MSLHKTVTRNVIWNWAGLATGMITGFLMVPFLVHRMGDTNYGLWVLILSLLTTLGLLDLGLRSSIGRHVAFYKAKGDAERVAVILGTAQAILIGSAVVALIVALAAQLVFVRAFDIPTAQIAHVRVALLLTGLTVAVALVMGVYDATLWAYERFDIINAIEITMAIAQTTLAMGLVYCGYSIVALSLLMLLTIVVREGAKGIACYRLTRQRIRPARASWEGARCLFGYALWSALWGVGQRMTAQSVPMIVGGRLGLSSVTPFNVAASLATYARGFVATGTTVLTPVATALHAADRRTEQQRLLIEGSKYTWLLSILLVSGLVLLGKAFVSLWIGAPLARWSGLVTILALGEALPMSQGIATSLIMAMNRHRVLAIACLVEAVAVIALGLLLAGGTGLWCVCWVVACCGMVCRGLVPMIYACRAVRLPLRQYVMQALIPPLAVAILPVTALGLLVSWRTPESWLDFLLYATVFSAAILFVGAVLLRREKPEPFVAATVFEVESA